MKVYLLNTSNVKYSLEKISFLISSYEMSEGMKYSDKKRRDLIMLSSLLKRYILSKELKCRLDDVDYYFNNKGRPFVCSDEKMFFSISKSNDLVAMVIDKENIAVDIESILDEDINTSEFSDLLNVEEIKIINSLTYKNKSKEFIYIWTAKESFLKYKGLGLTRDLDKLTVKRGIISTRIFDKDKKCKEHIGQMDIGGKYVLSLCSKSIKHIYIRWIDGDVMVKECLGLI